MPEIRPGLRRLAALVLVAAAAGCGRGAGPRAVWRQTQDRTPVTSVAVAGGELWIGTVAGLIRVPAAGGAPLALPGEAARLDPALANVRSVVIDGDDVWLGTAGGVARISRGAGHVTRWTVANGLGNDNVRSVSLAGGRVWAATIAGVSRLDAGGRRWTSWKPAQGLSSPHVYRIAGDGRTVWASCIGGGLARFEPAANRWTPLAPDHGRGNRSNFAIVPAPEGLWLGTAAGVNFWDAKTKTWDPAICDDGFTDYCVYALALTDGPTLWFGTAYGLYRRDLTTGRQRVYTVRDGLPHDEIVGLVPDAGTLWIATKAGVASLQLR